MTNLPDIFPSDDFHSHFDRNDYQSNSPVEGGASLPTHVFRDNLRTNNYTTYPLSNGSTSSEFDDEKLLILAEPRVLFRARYESEVDRIKNRAQRYIRTDDGTPKYDHPTLKVRSIIY